MLHFYSTICLLSIVRCSCCVTFFDINVPSVSFDHQFVRQGAHVNNNEKRMIKNLLFLGTIAVASCAISTPKKFDVDGGFVPSSPRYYNPSPQISRADKMSNRSDNDMASSEHLDKLAKDDPNRLQRFGLSGYGTGISGYPQTGVGGYAPLKIDIGGVVLGTLIGLGAILIIPKLGYLFSGGYRRSVENELESITDVLSRFDRTLEEHHIDSSSCMQRVICTYVRDAQKNVGSGQPSTLDEFIQTLTSNSMISFLLDGTSVQQAVEMGKRSDPDSCQSLHSKCPVGKENIMQVISSLLPA